MSMVDRLIAQLGNRGLTIKAGEKPGELLLSGPSKEKTPEVMAALKRFKPELVKRFSPLGEPDLPTEQRPDSVAGAPSVSQP